MQIKTDTRENTFVATMEGRLDAFGAKELEEQLRPVLESETQYLVLDLSAVDYMSSAGIRILTISARELGKRDGSVVLAGLQPYCTDVIEMTGFSGQFPAFPDAASAMEFCRGKAGTTESTSPPEPEQVELDCGDALIRSCGGEVGTVDVLGNVKDVLYARVTPTDIFSKKFFETEYSIGLGALGSGMDSFLHLLGEMITIGGTMVWLPTDGHDTPDFLIPKKDKSTVMIRTAFNVTINGGFNELIEFKSRSEGGTPIGDLYESLFKISRERRQDYRGVIGLAMRANMKSVFGSGVKKAPVHDQAPANGKMIMHDSNLEEWVESDATPRHTDVTALICGVGASLQDDLSDYDEEQLNRVFYLHPANISGKTRLLHNHAVIFNNLPMPEEIVSIDKTVQSAISEGTFLDMRHLLDNSCISEAVIGVSYIQSFRPDPHGERVDESVLDSDTRKHLDEYRHFSG